MQNFDIVPELQANFTFTRAYVAELTGSAGGLQGTNFFVDLSIFDRPIPDWIELGPTIDWSHQTLGFTLSLRRSTTFRREGMQSADR